MVGGVVEKMSVITRRSLLIRGSSCLTVIAVPNRKQERSIQERVLSLDMIHTGEKLRRVYWAEGRYIPQTLREIHYLLRDYHTNEVKEINVKLLDLLYEMQVRMESQIPFEIVSGYRSPETNKLLQRINPDVARHSYHTQGMAIDIRMPGQSLNKLKTVAIQLNRGGVGFYPNALFLHVDIGPCRQWEVNLT